VLYLRLIIFLVVGDVFIDSDDLKIKPAQFFGGAHRDWMCVCIYIDEYLYVYEYIRLYCISKKNYLSLQSSR
jgi:hypothetical protein